MIPTPTDVVHSGTGGWYVTVEVAHAALNDIGHCSTGFVSGVGFYTIYVDPWRH